MSRTLLLALTSICILAAVAGSGDAAEWQWAVDREGGKGRTFLWIPPHCKHARGVIMGQQVILEARFFDDPVIRAAAEKEDLAMVFNVPAIFGYESFDPTLDGDQKLKSLMDQLATVSGYAELAQAPILTIGHSGGAIFAWNLAWWHPERCFGVIGLHSAPIEAPRYKDTEKKPPTPSIDYVPVLNITGQYETWGEYERTLEWHWRWCRGSLLAMRGIQKFAYVSELVGPGYTHFGWDDAHARQVAMFIQKAAHYRIPADPPPVGQTP
ncbi:MAG: hypothetical protein ABSH20_01085, partial [Tepidisphaeraceae bacterium]